MNAEFYDLEAWFMGKWVKLLEVDIPFFTEDMIKKHKQYTKFRLKSQVTQEILAEAIINVPKH